MFNGLLTNRQKHATPLSLSLSNMGCFDVLPFSLTHCLSSLSLHHISAAYASQLTNKQAKASRSKQKHTTYYLYAQGEFSISPSLTHALTSYIYHGALQQEEMLACQKSYQKAWTFCKVYFKTFIGKTTQLFVEWQASVNPFFLLAPYIHTPLLYFSL